MVKYNLEPSESILIQSTGVCEGSGLMTAFTDELILTNMNIIHVSKGLFGNTKSVRKYPLNQVKIINGEAQASMGKSTNGIPNLQIYFTNGQLSFKFQSSAKKEIVKYVNGISKVLIGRESNLVANQFAIPGAEIVAETLKDTIGVFKGTLGIKSKGKAADEPVKATKKCIGCMSPLTGTKGQSIRCSYCDTDQIL
ncbi:hypothetical protein ABES03_14225 [Neobacillus rhizosphaerae]|uniref:hypothetical protein n=1 Tax=Neobacillus rhizosphaerae TaxID=2880965 RepID=UPI003D26871F